LATNHVRIAVRPADALLVPEKRLPVRGAKQSYAAQATPKARADARMKAAASPPEEFGMSLERPATRRLLMKMDEKDLQAP
jgi:hypothetical protein